MKGLIQTHRNDTAQSRGGIKGPVSLQNQPPSLEPCASQPSPSLPPSFPPALPLHPHPPAICHHVVGKSHISAATILPFSNGAGGGGRPVLSVPVCPCPCVSLCPGLLCVLTASPPLPDPWSLLTMSSPLLPPFSSLLGLKGELGSPSSQQGSVPRGLGVGAEVEPELRGEAKEPGGLFSCSEN